MQKTYKVNITPKNPEEDLVGAVNVHVIYFIDGVIERVSTSDGQKFKDDLYDFEVVSVI
jgi:hypothetical protein